MVHSLLKRSDSHCQPTQADEPALELALRFLGHRPRSKAEVSRYLLQRGYPSAAIEKTLEKLHALGYVNDANFARDWALSRAENLGHGPKRIEQDLETRGIELPLIQSVVGEIFRQPDESARAKLLLAKRFKNQDLTDAGTLRRAVALLRRRGYSGAVIARLLKLAIEDD